MLARIVEEQAFEVRRAADKVARKLRCALSIGEDTVDGFAGYRAHADRIEHDSRVLLHEEHDALRCFYGWKVTAAHAITVVVATTTSRYTGETFNA